MGADRLMSRKGLFNLIEGAAQADRDAGNAPPAPPFEPMRRPVGRGPVAALTNDLLANSEREIDPEFIEDESPSDRLAITDESVAGLRELIRTQGQIVPIVVRLNPERPDYYKIVYGRRRLAAVRGIPGLRVKALIRNLDEDQAVIAQGQENNARDNPSFIEKALFAAHLRARGHEPWVIQEALVTDKAMLSKMKSVTDTVPLELIRVIGAAPGVGRYRWLDLADLLEKHPTDDPVTACFPEGVPPESTSEQRLETALSALQKVVYRQPARGTKDNHETRLKDGSVLVTFKGSATKVDISVSKKAHPDFAVWLRENGDEIFGRLHEEWAKERGSD